MSKRWTAWHACLHHEPPFLISGLLIAQVMRDEEGDLEAVRMALDERLGRAPPPAYGRSHMAQLHLGVVQGAHPPETHMHLATTAKAKELQDQYKREYLKAKSIPALGMGTSPAKMKPTKKNSCSLCTLSTK